MAGKGMQVPYTLMLDVHWKHRNAAIVSWLHVLHSLKSDACLCDLQGASGSAATYAADADMEPPDDECHICMEKKVEVQIDACCHRMCIPCAKAVCCMPNRAPQCPFCRGSIIGMKKLPPQP